MSASLQVKKFNESVFKRLKLTRDGVCLKLLGAIVKDSPVDTGRFRGNWITNAKNPIVAELDVADKSGAATVASGTNAIKRASSEETIHITNNLPYAIKLEEGWSKQAPIGVMRRNVLRFQRLLDQEARKHKK